MWSGVDVIWYVVVFARRTWQAGPVESGRRVGTRIDRKSVCLSDGVDATVCGQDGRWRKDGRMADYRCAGERRKAEKSATVHRFSVLERNWSFGSGLDV